MKNTSQEQRETLLGTAHHEAGHAVIHHCFGHELTEVSIRPAADGSGGRTRLVNPNPTSYLDAIEFEENPEYRAAFEGEMVATVAGEAAEFLFTGKRNADGAADDREFLGEYLVRLFDCSPSDETREVDRYQDELWEKALILLRERWRAVEALAAVLIEKERLDGKQAEAIIRSGLG